MAQRLQEPHRSVGTQIEISASIAQVWAALVDANELVRWFAPVAKVSPGLDGHIEVSWGGAMTASWCIEDWQPLHFLQLREDKPLGGSTDGSFGDDLASFRRLMFALSYDDGRTTLSLRHGDFAGDQSFLAWIKRGWEFELLSLQHYLVNHAGKQRRIAWLRRRTLRPAAAVWNQLMQALVVEPNCGRSGLHVRQSVAITLGAAEIAPGVIVICDPPHQLAVTMADHGGELLRIKLFVQADGSVDIDLWMAAWDNGRPRLAGFARHWKELFAGAGVELDQRGQEIDQIGGDPISELEGCGQSLDANKVELV